MTTIVDIDLPPRPRPTRRYSVYSFVGDPQEDLGKFGPDVPVIPPFTIHIGNLKYECDALGLKTYGCYFDNNVRGLIPQLLKDETGHLSIYQPILNTKHPKYWKAQAAFRGANHRAPLWDILSYFKRHPDLPMLQEIREIQTELVKEYNTKDKEERDRLWGIKPIDEKARVDPHRFLRETFADTEDVEVVVVKVGYRFTLHAIASGKDLHHVSTDAPPNPDGTLPKISRWLIIGRTYEAVEKKLKEIQDERARVKSEIEMAKNRKGEEEAAEQQRVDRQLRIAIAHAELWENCHINTTAPSLDISGKWVITPLHVDKEFVSPAKKCTIYFVHCMEEDGSCHMWATFDFIELQGMFNFENPEHLLNRPAPDPNVSSVATSPDRLVISSDEEDDDNDMDYKDNGVDTDDSGDDEPDNESGEPIADEDNDEDLLVNDEEDILSDGTSDYKESKSDFYIGHDIRPSFALPTWDFRWRGRSTDGTLQVGSEEDLCTLRFIPTGPDSCVLEGRFYSELIGDFEFQGCKIFTRPRLAPFPDNPYGAIYQWRDLAPPTPPRTAICSEEAISEEDITSE